MTFWVLVGLELLVFGYGCYGLAGPATSWVNKGPAEISNANQKLATLGNFISLCVLIVNYYLTDCGDHENVRY